MFRDLISLCEVLQDTWIKSSIGCQLFADYRNDWGKNQQRIYMIIKRSVCKMEIHSKSGSEKSMPTQVGGKQATWQAISFDMENHLATEQG